MNSVRIGAALSVGCTLVLGAGAVLATASRTADLRHPPGLTFDAQLSALAAWSLLGCVVWAALLAVAAAIESGTRGAVRATTWLGCPPGLRRVLLAGLGLALVGGGAAQACPTTAGRPAEAWLPVPSRPVGGTPPSVVVVESGDSLWHIAEESRSHPRTAAEVLAVATQIHRRNRAVVGPDPDLIQPGQRLTLPNTRYPPHQHHEEIP